MKMKKLLVFFLTLLFSIYIVSAADIIDIVESSLSLSAQQGTTKSSSFTINNTGTTTLNLAFTSSTLTKGSDTLTINSISNLNNIANGTSRSVGFNIPIGSNQALGVYTGTISATNASNGAVFDTLTINVNVTPSFSLSSSTSSISFTDVKRNSTRTATFTITNNGNGNLTGVIPTSTAASKYNIGFNKTGFSLNTGQSETLKFNVTTPSDEQTTNHSIGNIVINSNEFSKSIASINIDVKGGLIIDELDVRVFYREGGTDVDQNVNNGERVDFGDDDDEIGPGDEIEFRVNLENTFTSSEDIDIEDITVTITIEEIDDGEDIDEESDEFDLDPGETERVIVPFKIKLEVEEQIYDVLIEVEGVDDEGTSHEIVWNLKISINKDRRDIIIRKASLTQNTLSCSRETRLNIEVLNIGTKIEDDVKVEVLNDDIGLNFVEDDIELDIEPFEDDDEYDKSILIKVDNNVAAGNYPITVNAYITGGALFATETVNLEVKACGTSEEVVEEPVEEVKEEEETVTVEEPEVKEEEEEGIKISVLEGEVTETKESSIGSSIVLILIITGVVAVGIGLFVGMKLIQKK